VELPQDLSHSQVPQHDLPAKKSVEKRTKNNNKKRRISNPAVRRAREEEGFVFQEAQGGNRGGVKLLLWLLRRKKPFIRSRGKGLAEVHLIDVAVPAAIVECGILSEERDVSK